MLSGEGADETMAGYLYFHKVQFHPGSPPRPKKRGREATAASPSHTHTHTLSRPLTHSLAQLTHSLTPPPSSLPPPAATARRDAPPRDDTPDTGAEREGAPRGVRAQGPRPPLLRLRARQQGDDGTRPRGRSSDPRWAPVVRARARDTTARPAVVRARASFFGGGRVVTTTCARCRRRRGVSSGLRRCACRSSTARCSTQR